MILRVGVRGREGEEEVEGEEGEEEGVVVGEDIITLEMMIGHHPEMKDIDLINLVHVACSVCT